MIAAILMQNDLNNYVGKSVLLYINKLINNKTNCYINKIVKAWNEGNHISEATKSIRLKLYNLQLMPFVLFNRV